MQDEPVIEERAAPDGVEVRLAAERPERERVADAVRLQGLQQELELEDGVLFTLDAVAARGELGAE